jgi:hypothetical protein
MSIRPLPLCTLLAALGCTSTGVDGSRGLDGWSDPDASGSPPDALTVLLPALVAGETVSIAVTGASEGDILHLAGSVSGAGEGPDVARLGGLSVQLDDPRLLGSQDGDADGGARFRLTLPVALDGADLCFQTFAERGEAGADSVASPVVCGGVSDGSFVVVDTGASDCWGADGEELACDTVSFGGQDASHAGHAANYLDNGDGTVSDRVTGLMWVQAPGDKVGWSEAADQAHALRVGGHDDWRVPTIKELYSLIDFSGRTGMSADDAVPYIDTSFFAFEYGDESAGERYIDAQYLTQTRYVSTTMYGDATEFGVNFADGRIKGYPIEDPRTGEEKPMFARYVRGNPGYGFNAFDASGEGTVRDHATALTWEQADSEEGLDWEAALARCADLELAGVSDWRLPNAKELQSIIDYGRSPATHGTAAIDPVFLSTPIADPEGGLDYGHYWSSTTHLDGATPGSAAVYVAFGSALGFMEDPITGYLTLLDVHGAGAQRSDPKSGDPADYPFGHGPQGDVIGIDNLVRCVRGG